MKIFLYIVFIIPASLQACLDLEQQSTIQIQNFECPVYLHPPSCGQRQEYEFECTCAKHPNYGPGIYNTGTYLGVDQKYPIENVCNTGTYLGSYPQSVDKFCPTDVKKSFPKSVELDTTLIYGIPQSHQNRQCEFKYASYF